MAYMPERGEAVWITLNPQAGHEQAGRRPAVVLSPAAYNSKVGLAILCPITNQIKGYPFEVVLPTGLAVTGAILSDQVKSLDWRAECDLDLRSAASNDHGSAPKAQCPRLLGNAIIAPERGGPTGAS